MKGETHMGVAARIGRKAVRLANGAVDTAVLLAVLLLVAVGGYAIWDSRQVDRRADAARYEKYKPSADTDDVFKELQTINPEIIAWLTVYGTNIDYPVAHSPESNTKYVNTDAMGWYSLSGALFLDRNCKRDFSDFNSIIYGHHMEKQTMFGEIGLFADKSYFDARQYGRLYYGGQEHGLEFFALVHTSAHDGAVYRTRVSQREQQEAYLTLLLSTAVNTRNVPVTTDDRLVMLSTCSSGSTNGRDILIGRITDELYDDPFKTEKSGTLTADRLSGLWAQTPLWIRISILSLLLLTLLLLLPLMIQNTRRKKRTKKLPDKGDE